MAAELNTWEKHIKRAVKEATEEVAEHARTHHRFKSRSGAKSLETNIGEDYEDNGMTGVVRMDPSVSYGVYVHEGTKPHAIFPKNKKSLRWPKPKGSMFQGKGNFIFAKRVQHPGTDPDPFIYDALAAKTEDVERIFAEHVDNANKEIADVFGN